MESSLIQHLKQSLNSYPKFDFFEYFYDIYKYSGSEQIYKIPGYLKKLSRKVTSRRYSAPLLKLLHKLITKLFKSSVKRGREMNKRESLLEETRVEACS